LYTVQGLAAVMRSSSPNEVAFTEFYEWYFEYLRDHSDATTGYWVAKTKDKVNQLGGAFHLYKMFSCFNLSWQYPDKVVDTTLATQNQTDGMWRTGNGGTHPGLSNCIDLDGIYSLTRSAQLVSTNSEEVAPYRWADVKDACDRYVRTAHMQLSDPANVLQGAWALESHLMHGSLNAVAECAQWFPELVKTVRPWRRAGGRMSARSCFYA
jgi:hypothetical protein